MLVHSKLFTDASKKAGVKHMVVRQQADTAYLDKVCSTLCYAKLLRGLICIM